VSGTYAIAATYCQPNKGPGDIVQVLTHGIAFDRSYWDVPINRYNYSYVKEAVDKYSFSTLAYDRLGIGESQHGNPVSEIQAWLEVAALSEITKKLRAGKIPKVPCKFGKVVHVGHSFGSVQSYQLTAMEPELSDGVILTGFSQNPTYIPYFALGGNFVQANLNPALDNYSDGYLASSNPSAVQTNFFSPVPGTWDPALLDLAWKTGQPVTVGELLTIGSLAQAVNPVKGPVLIITGERDIPFCGGNCYGTGNSAIASIPAASAKFFPKTSNFTSFIIPEAGHGLNLVSYLS
jgi:pimeloyl-ACP methyl ester carboxylesterase